MQFVANNIWRRSCEHNFWQNLVAKLQKQMPHYFVLETKNSQRPWVQNTHYPQCGSARVFWPDTFKGAPQKLFDGFVSIRWGKYPKNLPYVFRGQSWGLALRTWVPIQILPLFRQNICQIDSEGLPLRLRVLKLKVQWPCQRRTSSSWEIKFQKCFHLSALHAN